jgi:4a-hydroxytetrahydrobiopterin dehydratase
VREVDDMKRLEKVFKLKNFVQALEFTNKIGAAAEEENHHPLIITEWGKVTVQWWTYVVNGLHKNDFIMTAKTDEVYEKKACKGRFFITLLGSQALTFAFLKSQM